MLVTCHPRVGHGATWFLRRAPEALQQAVTPVATNTVRDTKTTALRHFQLRMNL